MHQITRRTCLALAATALSCAALAQVPAGYPASYQSLIDAAKKEGKVTIYTPTDAAAGKPLVKEFESLYPGVKVEYMDMNSVELFNRFISETAAGTTSADVVWNSAMDQAVKLVAEGYAQPYESVESRALPAWAVYQKTAYGTTFEPLGLVYNKRLLPAADLPKTHADLVKLLADPRLQGKVTTYDIEKAGVGFLYLTADVHVNPTLTWDVVKAMAGAGVKLQSSSSTMMERISSGEQLLGYNMITSYAHARGKKDSNIGYVLLKDHTLVMSRVAFIAKGAKNPNAAKLWLDYLLSRRGQTTLATASELYSIRSDVEGEMTAQALQKELGLTLRPIAIDQNLLTYLEQGKRLDFIKTWRSYVARK
ncbi:ABC transporter substrate-binding protein [Mitsuaria sp. WAJ17]|uniref:ABC transporter substrate-binding protein n=1 Tax=Mitsuaria sp. WAJ17 TaxID=2761452 RepID=UPI0015FF7004|nr:ABC transporter substrate-binding protein [Mitsuaria sp. WAJ17]MBB2484997.1 ABC transporter substrate-binding protein [Mitsuaria sp. WAJ17]